MSRLETIFKTNKKVLVTFVTGCDPDYETSLEILKEISNTKLYREFQVDYKNFIDDTNINEVEVDAKNLIKKIKIFFNKNGLLLNWKEFEKLDRSQQINTLAMIAPITNEEKQKLLESISLEKKVNVLENIITFYLHNSNLNNFTLQ